MAINGKKKLKLCRETILSFITEYDIYRLYMPNKFELNKRCKSPFHKDDSPSFIIGTKFGEITHKDFSDSDKKGNCFKFVQQLLNCSYIEALKAIDRDFGLGIENGEPSKHNTIVTTYKQPEIIVEKKYSTIQCITRKFTKEELDYWSMYYQDVEDLKRENIYAIKSVFLNKQRFALTNELRFGYLYNNEHWKIYTPFSKNPQLKWMPNNVPLTYLDGKDNIINSDVCIITKSKKDKMVIKKIYPNVCDVQNESITCFSEENVEFIKSSSKKQILCFDSDKPGVKNSLIITEKFGFDYLNVPKQYLSDGVTDFADLAKEYGIQKVEQIFKKKKLL